jgi:LysR family transcriptional activator of nhaA
VLTDTGQLVLAYADNIFGLGQEMLGRLEGRSAGVTRLRMGSVATLSRNYQENWLRPMLWTPGLLSLESGTLEGLLERLMQHQLDVVLANETVPSDPDRPLHCRFLGSQAVSVVGPAHRWEARSCAFRKTWKDGHGPARSAPCTAHAVRCPVHLQRCPRRACAPRWMTWPCCA